MMRSWWDTTPSAFAFARDPDGSPAAFQCLCEATSGPDLGRFGSTRPGRGEVARLPARLLSADPVAATWRAHLRTNPVPRAARPPGRHRQRYPPGAGRICGPGRTREAVAEMRLTVRDGLATVFVAAAAAAVVYLLWVTGTAMTGWSVRVTAAVVFALGFAACLSDQKQMAVVYGAAGEGPRPASAYAVLASAIGALALAAEVIALVAGSVAMLATLVASMGGRSAKTA